MMRWVILAAIVVVLTAGATVALQFLPEMAATDARAPGAPVGLGTTAKPTGPQPKAVVEEPFTYEFGTLPQRVTGKHTWKVENRGEGPLDIWMIESTCSCTLAKFKNGEKATVPPGETTEIDLEFETRETNGDYAKGAKIGTNDPDFPSFDLQVHGKVYPAVMTIPADGVLNYSNISNDTDQHEGNFALYSKDTPDIKITGVKVSNPDQITVTYEPITDEDKKILEVEKGYRVRVNIKDGLPLGMFREEVLLSVDHPKQPEVKMVLSGRMSGPVNLLPDRLIMHQVNARTGGQGELFISVRGNRETKFETLSVPKNLQVTVVPADVGGQKGRYKLRVTIPPGSSPAQIDDEIVLKTDHPKGAELHVPVSIWIQNSLTQ